MFARTDHQGSGDGETSKDEATRTFSVELVEKQAKRRTPKGTKLLGRLGVCNAIFHEAGKKVKRVLKWSGGSKRALTVLWGWEVGAGGTPTLWSWTGVVGS